jgi:hypothetical protein
MPRPVRCWRTARKAHTRTEVRPECERDALQQSPHAFVADRGLPAITECLRHACTIYRRGRIRTALRLNQDGNAEIEIKGKVAGSDERLRTTARWQVLDDRSLHLLGTQSITWKIVKLNSGSMTTTALAESSFPVHWIKHPKVNAKVWLLVAAAMVLPASLIFAHRDLTSDLCISALAFRPSTRVRFCATRTSSAISSCQRITRAGARSGAVAACGTDSRVYGPEPCRAPPHRF